MIAGIKWRGRELIKIPPLNYAENFCSVATGDLTTRKAPLIVWIVSIVTKTGLIISHTLQVIYRPYDSYRHNHTLSRNLGHHFGLVAKGTLRLVEFHL